MWALILDVVFPQGCIWITDINTNLAALLLKVTWEGVIFGGEVHCFKFWLFVRWWFLHLRESLSFSRKGQAPWICGGDPQACRHSFYYCSSASRGLWIWGVQGPLLELTCRQSRAWEHCFLLSDWGVTFLDDLVVVSTLEFWKPRARADGGPAFSDLRSLYRLNPQQTTWRRWCCSIPTPVLREAGLRDVGVGRVFFFFWNIQSPRLLRDFTPRDWKLRSTDVVIFCIIKPK